MKYKLRVSYGNADIGEIVITKYVSLEELTYDFMEIEQELVREIERLKEIKELNNGL